MLFPCPYEFSGEYSNILFGLFSLGWVPLRSTVCLDDESFGFILSKFHVGNITIQLACILADELVAFSDL
jgi:hypothetical protein